MFLNLLAEPKHMELGNLEGGWSSSGFHKCVSQFIIRKFAWPETHWKLEQDDWIRIQ